MRGYGCLSEWRGKRGVVYLSGMERGSICVSGVEGKGVCLSGGERWTIM